MARLKAFLPHLNRGKAGIVDLNPSTEYVKPFDQETMPHTTSDAIIKLTDQCD